MHISDTYAVYIIYIYIIFVYINYIKLYIYIYLSIKISDFDILWRVARLALALQGEATQCFSIDGEVGCKIHGDLEISYIFHDKWIKWMNVTGWWFQT